MTTGFTCKQPIQTTYKGYRFRSRLEARWAVFFETCSLPWVYEKEGYNLESGPYLPDFWLPSLKLWAEIKPEGTISENNHPKEASELIKVFELAEETEYPACLIEGTPGNERIHFIADECTDSSGGLFYTNEARWVSCNGIITLDLNRGRDHEIYTPGMTEWLPWFSFYQRHPTFRCPIKIAYQQARSARFEHGETFA